MRTYVNVRLSNDEQKTLRRIMGFADAAINQKYPESDRAKSVRKFSTQIKIVTEHNQGTHEQFVEALRMAAELKEHLLGQTQPLYWQAVAAALGEFVANEEEFAQHYAESAKAALRDLEPAIEVIRKAISLTTAAVDEDWETEEIEV